MGHGDKLYMTAPRPWEGKGRDKSLHDFED